MIRTKWILLSLLTIVFMVATRTSQGQVENGPATIEAQSLTKKEIRKQRPRFFGIGLAANSSKFRDFATSPLFYRGVTLQVSLAQLKIDHNRESELGISYGFGAYSTNFNDNNASSRVKRVELHYSQLYHFAPFSSNKIITKIGFQLNGNSNIRTNPELQNNSLGIDIFTNLLASIKVTKEIGRSNDKERKFLFWKSQQVSKRNLAFRLNVGLVNSSYRNGFAYSNHSSVLNEPKIFNEYEFKIASGFRAGSSLDYTRFLKNKNAFRISYVWNAYATGGDLDKFEMAHHTLKLTLLFNTNNR